MNQKGLTMLTKTGFQIKNIKIEYKNNSAFQGLNECFIIRFANIWPLSKYE